MSTTNDATARLTRVRANRGYEPVSRAMAQDASITPKALGLLVYLLSLPDAWHTNIRRIAQERNVGREYVASGLRELERAGYLHRERRHIGGGRWEWLWAYSDDPDALGELVAAAAIDPNQLAAFAVPPAANGDPAPGQQPDDDGTEGLFPQVVPINGFPGHGPVDNAEPAGQTMNGFPVHGNPSDGKAVDGKPVDIEKDSLKSPLPPAGPADSRASGSAPASGAPDSSPPSCGHGLIRCRTCGTNPRAAQRRIAQTVKAAITRCRMCDNDGYRWDPQTHVPVTPYRRCDHTTPHAAVIATIDDPRPVAAVP